MRIRVERHVQFSNCAIKTKTNSLSGTVDLSELPEGFKVLNLSDNELSGEVLIPDMLFSNVDVENTNIMKRHME